jgi:hypothetical protein
VKVPKKPLAAKRNAPNDSEQSDHEPSIVADAEPKAGPSKKKTASEMYQKVSDL